MSHIIGSSIQWGSDPQITSSTLFETAYLFLIPFLCALVPYSSTMPRKTRTNRVPSTPSVSPSRVQLFRNERSHEAYEKLNSKRKIWGFRDSR